MSLWVNENGTMKEIAIDENEANSSLILINYLSESNWDLNLDQLFDKVKDWVGWGQTLDSSSKLIALKVKTITLPFSCNILKVNNYANNPNNTLKESAIFDNISSTTLTDMYYGRSYNNIGAEDSLLLAPGEFFKSDYNSFDRFSAKISGFSSSSIESIASNPPIFEFKDSRTINLYTFLKLNNKSNNTYPTKAQVAGATVSKTYSNLTYNIAIEFSKVS